MPKVSRPPLFTADPGGQGSAADSDILPRKVQPRFLRVLWVGLLVMLAVLVVIVQVWRIGGI